MTQAPPAPTPPLEVTQASRLLASLLGASCRPLHHSTQGWHVAVVFTMEQTSAIVSLHDAIVKLPHMLDSVRTAGER